MQQATVGYEGGDRKFHHHAGHIGYLWKVSFSALSPEHPGWGMTIKTIGKWAPMEQQYALPSCRQFPTEQP